MSGCRPPVRRRSEEGSFLLQAVVALALLVLVFTYCVQATVGDALIVGKALRAEESRRRAMGLEARARACLDGDPAALTACDPVDVQACLEALETDGATVSLSGARGRCVIRITVSR